MEKPLTEKRCVPCEGGVAPFSEEEIKEYRSQLNSEWDVLENKAIRKRWKFKDFQEAVAFVNAVAKIAEEESHHPDIRVFGYRNVEIELSTHAIGGLSENDFILAAKIERIAE